MSENIFLVMECEHCGKTLEIPENEDLTFCPHCYKPMSKESSKSTLKYMALIPCPDCGKKISRKATECPNCGRPMAPNYAKKIYALLKWVVIISVLVGAWHGCQMAKIYRFY